MRVVPIVDQGLGNSAYLVDLGDGQGMVIDPETGLLLWPLSGTSVGEVEVSVSVTDEEGLWARQEFTIQLSPLKRQTHD